MLTDNEDCDLVLISTPNGRQGFFYNAMCSSRWEKYEVRSPWDVLDLEYKLVPAEPEEGYRAGKAERGIRGFYSPRHRNRNEQQMNLEEMGPMMYHQEYGCEFVEPEDQVFSYEDVETAFSQAPKSAPFELSSIPEAVPLPGLTG
jgi:hypothetical protein